MEFEVIAKDLERRGARVTMLVTWPNGRQWEIVQVKRSPAARAPASSPPGGSRAPAHQDKKAK